MEDFVVKYFTYFFLIALAAWSFFMFIGMIKNVGRMNRKYYNPDEKMTSFMTKCKVEAVVYLIIPIICAALVFLIHARYNT